MTVLTQTGLLREYHGRTGYSESTPLAHPGNPLADMVPNSPPVANLFQFTELALDWQR